jgi:DNA topoisomerase-1
MKYVMKSLCHNGIYVPQYEYKGFYIKIDGHTMKLQSKSEQMIVAWVRKAQSKTSPPDKVYYRNFIQEFLKELRLENPSLNFLEPFSTRHLANIDRDEVKFLINETSKGSGDIDLSEIIDYLRHEQERKLSMTKEEKKKLAQERKVNREGLRERFGYAYVDGTKMEIANWTAEPSCLFAGRGDHPKRGKWKEGPVEEDITLNLSPDSPKPSGNWKDVVWDPDKMFLAKWTDKLFGKVKYVWFSDSAFLKQDREKEKFIKAEKLGKEIPKVEGHIMKNLNAKDDERRKIATVAWLLLELNIRVGDEKDPEEADTVGAITLRPEHIKVEGDTLHFDFLGKDSVRWVSKIKAPPAVIENIKHFSETCREYLFEGIDSKKVSRFLSEVMKGLTAKVFRTWKCTQIVKEHLTKCRVKREDAEYVKKFEAKMANLEGAKVANHKRKIPPNFNERLSKKEVSLRELEVKLKEKEQQGKKTEALRKRIEKSKLDIKLTRETQEYNLGTSLKSYIDPNVYAKWAKEVNFSLEKFYPATLRKKFSWALEKH